MRATQAGYRRGRSSRERFQANGCDAAVMSPPDRWIRDEFSPARDQNARHEFIFGGRDQRDRRRYRRIPIEGGRPGRAVHRLPAGGPPRCVLRGRARVANRSPGNAARNEAHPLIPHDNVELERRSRTEKWQRPLAGSLRCDARRRIPATPTHQVAGTWLVHSFCHPYKQGARCELPVHGVGRRLRGSSDDGQISSSTQAPHRGFFASHTRRPCRMVRRLNGPHSAGGR